MKIQIYECDLCHSRKSEPIGIQELKMNDEVWYAEVEPHLCSIHICMSCLLKIKMGFDKKALKC